MRPVEPADFDAIAALTNHFIVNTSIHFGYDPVTPDDLRASWEQSRGRYPYLVAEIGEAPARLIGYAKSGPWRDRAAYQWTAEAGIYVAPDMHGRGTGRRLYAELIAECRRRGFHSLVGGVTQPNDASMRLHESLGFVRVGCFRHAGWKLGAWHDVMWWQLMLRDEGHTAGRLPDAIP
ncbi:MAG: N-acetyltransferase [Phycisphaerae bacterium]|nr:N-acetyltransferase [Phycisphaerae bacterium]